VETKQFNETERTTVDILMCHVLLLLLNNILKYHLVVNNLSQACRKTVFRLAKLDVPVPPPGFYIFQERGGVIPPISPLDKFLISGTNSIESSQLMVT